jgi:cysteine desulfurase
MQKIIFIIISTKNNARCIMGNKMRVYLDYHSTTAVDPKVLNVMLPYFTKHYGNPASLHIMGIEAKDTIENAKQQVANIINAKSDNIFFTNSATEANNIILKSFDNGNPIVITNSEHASIIECSKHLGPNVLVKKIKIEENGTISISKLRKMISFYKPALVSIMAANNEIGTVHDLYEIGCLCKKYGSLFHTDAAQAIGKIDIDVNEMNIFALTISGHKIYGPKGIGALYVKDASQLSPLTHGGYQNTFISGTQNVPNIVGIGKACELLIENKNENDRIGGLRNYLLDLLNAGLNNIFVNGTMHNRLPNNLNITIMNVPAKALVMGLDNVIISSGSACKSGESKSSHVIKAIKSEYPEGAIRISLGRWTTKEEIEYAANSIIAASISIRRQNE